jgi:hypothetical protein
VGIPLAKCNNDGSSSSTTTTTTTMMILDLGLQLVMQALCNSGNNNTEDGCITEWSCCHNNNTATA